MIVRLYGIYDNVAKGITSGVMTFTNDTVAIRSFGDIMTENQELARHVQDYDLVYLGDLDRDSGMITGTTPREILTGRTWADIKRANQPELELQHRSNR